jgi:hypothetical protein
MFKRSNFAGKKCNNCTLKTGLRVCSLEDRRRISYTRQR